MDGFLPLALNAALIVCAGLLAQSKGRNVIAWVLLSVFFTPCLTLPLLLVLPDLQAERRAREHQRDENRRLREELRQERMRNDAFRESAQRRLEAHDQALGMDTIDPPYEPYRLAPGEDPMARGRDGVEPA